MAQDAQNVFAWLRQVAAHSSAPVPSWVPRASEECQLKAQELAHEVCKDQLEFRAEELRCRAAVVESETARLESSYAKREHAVATLKRFLDEGDNIPAHQLAEYRRQTREFFREAQRDVTVVALRTQVEKLTEEATARNKTVGSLRGTIDLMQAQQNFLNARLADTSGTLSAALMVTIPHKDEEIKVLKDEKSALESLVQRESAAMRAATDDIVRLHGELAACRQQLEHANAVAPPAADAPDLAAHLAGTHNVAWLKKALADIKGDKALEGLTKPSRKRLADLLCADEDSRAKVRTLMV